MATSAPIQSNVDHKIISISVDLGVTTPDGLRHIDFGLENDSRRLKSSYQPIWRMRSRMSALY